MNGVSIIICCHNAYDRITPALRHLQNQQFRDRLNWEVIVVDNASTDNTSEKANEVWNENPVTQLTLIREEKPGLMHARQSGLLHAQYRIVSFIDDDNWVETEWVNKVHNVFEADESIGACGGKNVAIFEKESPAWFLLFENNFAVGEQARESGYVDHTKGFLWGAGLSFRKSLWEELLRRGFKNLTLGRSGKKITAGEDSELCYAFRLLGYRLYYKEDLTLQHFMPENRMQFSYLEKMYQGFGRSNVYLNCYRVLLAPKSFRLHPWWYEWLVANKSIMLDTIGSVFSFSRNRRWKAKAQRAYWVGYAGQTLKTKSQTYKIINSLKKVFSDS